MAAEAASVAIPLVQTAMQVAGGPISTVLGAKYNTLAMWEQNRINVENWKMQNEYNSPAAQMARYQEAGLNPNLMYGQGNNGNAGSVPAAQMHPLKVENPFKDVNLMQAALFGEELKSRSLDNEYKTLKNAEEQQSVKTATYEARMKQEFFEALEVYTHDVSGNPKGSDFTEDQRKQIRETPWYYQFQREKLSAEQAALMLVNTNERNKLLEYQNTSNEAFDKLFQGNIQELDFGDILRILIRFLLNK